MLVIEEIITSEVPDNKSGVYVFREELNLITDHFTRNDGILRNKQLELKEEVQKPIKIGYDLQGSVLRHSFVVRDKARKAYEYDYMFKFLSDRIKNLEKELFILRNS
jgi:hypothetical protein